MYIEFSKVFRSTMSFENAEIINKYFSQSKNQVETMPKFVTISADAGNVE